MDETHGVTSLPLRTYDEGQEEARQEEITEDMNHGGPRAMLLIPYLFLVSPFRKFIV